MSEQKIAQEKVKELLEDRERELQEMKEEWKVPQGKKVWEGLWEYGHLRVYQVVEDDVERPRFDAQFFFPVGDGVGVSVDIEGGSLEELVGYLVNGRSWLRERKMKS